MQNDAENIKTLSSQPSVQEIQQITEQFLSQKQGLKIQIQYINTYISYILPVYSSLKNSLQLEVRKVFHSCSGISNLVNQYKLTKNDIYLKVMKDILIDSKMLSTVIDGANGNKMELSQIKSLFFGSKIFNTFEGKLVLDKYLQLLAKQLLKTCESGNADVDYFIGYLSIHPIESKIKLFQEFMTESNFPFLTNSVNRMNNLQKRQFYIKNLFPYLETLINTRNMNTIIRIISQLNFQSIEPQVVNYLAEVNTLSLQQAVTYCIREYTDAFSVLLQLWGDEQYIKDSPEIIQENLTKELLILSNYLTKNQLKDISTSRLFLNSITSRLSSTTRNRDFGIMIAKIVTNNEVKMDVEDEIVTEPLSHVNLDISIDFTELFITTDLSNFSISKKHTVQHDSDDESDEDQYDSQDEAEPVFLKDLISKMNSDKTRNITKLLSHTIKLVRQKATFKLEIEFYSEELISILVGLINRLNEERFEGLKLNAIVSVIVVNPTIISHVMKLLFTGDYSLQQRMVILSSISLSARELRGIDDGYIEKPTAEFPTSQIGSRKKLVEEVNIPRFEEIEDEKEEKLLGQGKVTRISSKLTKPKTKTKQNNFSKIAHKFFYPLATGWAEGINVGHYNGMFLKHYLQTMQLIISAAYPCHDFNNMAELFEEIKNNSSNIVI